MARHRSIAIGLYLTLTAGAAASVWQYSYDAGLDALARAGATRLDQATERLLGQLDSYRVLVNVLARHPDVVAAMDGSRDATDLLRAQALTFGAARIAIWDRDGARVAVSASDAPPSEAAPASRARLLTAALNGRLGIEHGLEDGARFFHFSRGILGEAATPRGAVIVSTSIAALEFEWGVVPEAIGFFDRNEVVFAANRPSLLLGQDRADGRVDPAFRAFASHSREAAGRHEIWGFGAVPDLPTRALVVAREVPRIAMTARGFLDIAPVGAAARLNALLTAALMGVIGLAALIVSLRRQRLTDRLAIEARANARLEARVQARTDQLRAAQEQLIQASKLTALGQMSAGISHELNQPLAAIMNFAENGGRLLDLDRRAEARGNLDQIAAQVHRIDRIIRNLRAFARNEDEPVEPVDLVAILDEAVALTAPALQKSAVTLTCIRPDAPVTVMGGRVRLQQVIVNLMTNAMDAMEGQAVQTLTIDLSPTARLTVRDTGPGIADPARVFEPFYSTKELGASKGLGLGLSITYGIIGSFGGEIMAENPSDGGALFTITLPLIEEAP